MDLGQAATGVGRVAFGLVFGGFLIVVSGLEVAKAGRDLLLRLTGPRVRAEVVGIRAERVEGETYSKYWVVVRFTARDGRTLDRVQLRNWTSMPPKVGARIRVSYRRDRPVDADRAQVGVALITLAVVAPFVAASGLFFAGVGLGLWWR